MVIAHDGGDQLVFEQVFLLIESGPSRGLEVPLGKRPWILGRGEEADLDLKDETVSRNHLRLEPCEEGFKITDLGSKGGTWVQGLRVESIALPPGVPVRLGNTEFLLQSAAITLHAEPKATGDFHGLKTACPSMQRLFGNLSKLARLDLPLLLLGESGTGKEKLARALHNESPQAPHNYEIVDCTLLSPEHIRSELFGHSRGAFTGATTDHVGAFERAHKGTLFLDEIGELPLALQPSLLRVLEEGEVRPLGATHSKRVRVRIVAATNRNLEQMVADGEFRLDLYQRLSAFELDVPPLRERPGDARFLAKHFLPPPLRLSEDALLRIEQYPWPGNIRELKNRLTRAAVLADGHSVTAENLGLSLEPRSRAENLSQTQGTKAPSTPLTVEELIEKAIRDSMRRNDNDRKLVCEELGISRATLYRKLKAMDSDLK